MVFVCRGQIYVPLARDSSPPTLEEVGHGKLLGLSKTLGHVRTLPDSLVDMTPLSIHAHNGA